MLGQQREHPSGCRLRRARAATKRLTDASANLVGCDFVARYLMPMIYPEGLTRDAQLVLGLAALVGNAVIYAIVWRRARC